MDLPGLLAERGVPMHVWPRHFVVIDQKSKLYQNAKKRRFNPQSDSAVPEGFVVCKPPCLLLAKIDYELGLASCPEGHVVDLDEEEEKAYSPGGCTRVGLTLKQQGDIAEEVVQRIQLGEWGVIIERCLHYNAPLDFVTSLLWGAEVKGKSTRASKLSYEPGNPKSRARKVAEAKRRGLKGILEILVILDFDTSIAKVFIKARPIGEDLKFWTMPSDEPFAVVDFTDINPFVVNEDKEREKTEIPF